MPIVPDTLSPADIEAMVKGAAIFELIDAMLVRTDYEDQLWDGFRDQYGQGRFPCPRCQFVDGRWHWLEWLGATVEDSVFWSCDKCRCRGTRWEIVDAVLRDAVALSDFLEAVTCGVS